MQPELWALQGLNSSLHLPELRQGRHDPGQHSCLQSSCHSCHPVTLGTFILALAMQQLPQPPPRAQRAQAQDQHLPKTAPKPFFVQLKA